MLCTVRYPSSRVHHAALLEHEESIQAALMETVNALLRGTIELKRGELIRRALNTAVRNIRRVKFGLHSDEMVREIPDFPTPPLQQIDEEYANELHRQEQRAARAKKEDPLIEYFGGAAKIPAHLRKPTPETVAPASGAEPHVSPTNVGTAAPGLSGRPRSIGRSAAPRPRRALRQQKSPIASRH
jgi:hypothetical protein